MTRTIVAIGGGDIGRTKTMADGTTKVIPNETMAIDAEIIRLSGKSAPRLLFIGAAKNDSPTYYAAVKNHFESNFDCTVAALNLITDAPDIATIERAIMNSDILYFSGGDTKLLIETLQCTGADAIVRQAYQSDIIISGMSAGAICWFESYDNEEYIDGDISQLGTLPGLGYISGFCTPHWNTKNDTEKQIMRDMLRRCGITGVALENNIALINEDGKTRFLTSQPGAAFEKLGQTRI